MPLTQCPDCGGVVSDAALTCPTCHRVLASVEPRWTRLARRVACWALGGALVAGGFWFITRILG